MKVSVQKIVEIAKKAGEAIMGYYVQPEGLVEYKADASPLTAADKASHAIIESALLSAYPWIPCISEEGKGPTYEERRDWEEFWLVDPLDGTKEFLKRTQDFTVNIALIRQTRPVIGVIYVPAKDLLYYASYPEGAWRQGSGEGPRKIQVSAPDGEQGLVVVASRSHRTEADDAFLKSFSIRGTTAVGSSLKFCVVAEGLADLYPRMGPTWEWDTAAGQCIVEVAGGSVVDRDGKPIHYNKPTLKNENFIASSGGFTIHRT